MSQVSAESENMTAKIFPLHVEWLWLKIVAFNAFAYETDVDGFDI